MATLLEVRSQQSSPTRVLTTPDNAGQHDYKTPEGTMVAIARKRAPSGSSSESVPTFEHVYEDLWWPMLRLAIGLLGSRAAAEDVVQDAFTATYRRWDSIASAAIPQYLTTAVVNASRSAVRRAIVARQRSVTQVDVAAASADDRVLLEVDHRLVRDAIQTLAPRQREVLILRYVSELSDKEIAVVTGMSEGSVRSTASRGLAALRTKLGGKP